jgi:hypothetical protein
MRRRKLDNRLRDVREEAQQLVDGKVVGEVAILDAALRIEGHLGGTRWTQRRYQNFTLTPDELVAIHRMVRGWRISGPETDTEIIDAARALLRVGL